MEKFGVNQPKMIMPSDEKNKSSKSNKTNKSNKSNKIDKSKSSIASDDSAYSLKIKNIGNQEPNKDDFNDSDIYINQKSKKFYIKTSNGFTSFPLNKKSIVRYEKI